VILGVPFIGVHITPSNDLHSLHIGNQHLYPVFGHLVLGSYPGHRLGVFGLKDATEQVPVHSPRRNGFGAVGAVAVNALLADVDLPAAKIGGGWFHWLGVYGLEKLILPAFIGYVFYLRPESVASAQHILAGITLGPNLNHLPRAVVGAGCQEQKEQYAAHVSKI
jgi:hypothetical protein